MKVLPTTAVVGELGLTTVRPVMPKQPALPARDVAKGAVVVEGRIYRPRASLRDRGETALLQPFGATVGDHAGGIRLVRGGSHAIAAVR